MNTNKQELKIRALLERISSLTATYENQVADLRVELTFTSEELERTIKELSNLREINADFTKSEPDETDS